MTASVPQSTFDSAYETGTPPWVIGEPQPAIVGLEHDGWIRGTVLDPGCGSGDNSIHLTQLGYDVLGIDFSAPAVEQARANATRQGIPAKFEAADALHLGDEPRFDTVIDSALFHVFGDEDRAQYVRSLHAVVRPGGLVHVLALSDTEPGSGPRISDGVIREAFGEGWTLEELRPSQYRANGNHTSLGIPEERTGEAVAWLARARRS